MLCLHAFAIPYIVVELPSGITTCISDTLTDTLTVER